MNRVGTWLGRNVVPLLAGVWFVFLGTWIVLRGSDLSGVHDPDQALLASTERLAQMAQWTVTTVLTLGGALIGLNWYQNERRYQQDRASLEDRVNGELQELHEKVKFLEFVSSTQVQMSVFQAVAQRAGDPESPEFVSKSIEGYRSANGLPMRSAFAQVLRQYAIAASENGPTHYTRQGLDELREFTVELRRDIPAIANEISVLLSMADARNRGEEVDTRG